MVARMIEAAFSCNGRSTRAGVGQRDAEHEHDAQPVAAADSFAAR
jgi:hypothetical protein